MMGPLGLPRDRARKAIAWTTVALQQVIAEIGGKTLECWKIPIV
jgi:hypothetical protein